MALREWAIAMTKVLFVSVNKSCEDWMNLVEMEPFVERAWALSLTKAQSVDRVVAVFHGEPRAAWRVRGAFTTDETYTLSSGDSRPRIGLSLGDPLQILGAYYDPPGMRHGVAVADLDCEPLNSER